MVLVYGTLCLDRIRSVPFLPPPGGYVEITSEIGVPGGEACNTAAALRILGIDTVLIVNAIGDDAAGDLLARMVEGGPLKGTRILMTSGLTAFCDIYVTPNGERTMFGMGFSTMDTSSLPETIVFGKGWFTAEPNHGEDARRAVQLARNAGMSVYLLDFDPKKFAPLPGEFWQSSTDLFGKRFDNAANLKFVEECAHETGATIILSDGRVGFFAAGPGLPPRHFPAYVGGRVIDATGAGDVFRAGMLFGLDQAWPLSDCFRFASAAARLNCSGYGGHSAAPTKEAVLKLIEEKPGVSSQFE